MPAQPYNESIAFHLLAKPTGAICNLDCRYCYYLSKEELYPNGSFRMADGLLESYLQQLLESHKTSEVTVAWQGGEPTLMGLEFFERSVELVQRYRRPEQRVNHTIQTNGTRLDDDWCRFFSEHDFLVGLSVDGPQSLHNKYRVDLGGQGSFEQVVASWNLLVRHQVDVNILCAVHGANGDHPLEVYRFFRDELDAEFIQFIPVVERAHRDNSELLYPDQLVTKRSVTSEQYGQFLIEVFDEWVRRDVGKVFVQHFDAALANWLGIRPGVCVFLKTCGDAVVLEHNGDLYSCDHFVDPEYRLGNILETPMGELISSEQQRRFGLDKWKTLPQRCLDCEVRFACNGGCPRNRFSDSPTGEPRLSYLCAGYKAFFTHLRHPMRIMAELIRRGRRADEIMALLPNR